MTQRILLVKQTQTIRAGFAKNLLRSNKICSALVQRRRYTAAKRIGATWNFPNNRVGRPRDEWIALAMCSLCDVERSASAMARCAAAGVYVTVSRTNLVSRFSFYSPKSTAKTRHTLLLGVRVHNIFQTNIKHCIAVFSSPRSLGFDRFQNGGG